MKEVLLSINNLTKSYGKVTAVKDLSLELYQGEVFGFIGPNGAGKSTTIRSIMNLVNIDSGSISLLGEALTRDNYNLKRSIGYLPSEINLYDDLSVKSMLDYHESFYTIDTHTRRCELVSRLELDESKRIEDLSLGNLKKLGIILALMHKPKLLILDEPTSGLDPIMQQEFYKILQEEKSNGTTIFYSTHILSEVSKICDRVGIIKDGVLLNIEKVSDIAKRHLSVVTLTSKDVDNIIKTLGIEVVDREGDTIKFNSSLTDDKLIKSLSKFSIDKILINEPSLEEMLLHYYR